MAASEVNSGVVVNSDLNMVYLLQRGSRSPLELQTAGACCVSYISLETVTSEENHKDT